MSTKLWRISFVLLVAVILLGLPEYIAAEWLKATVHEIGFALLVSVCVWGFFELHTTRETDDLWNKRVEHIAQNVFFAVLQKNLPKQLIDEANAIILNKGIIRKNFNITYSLKDKDYIRKEGGAGTCVLMTAVASFDMENVGSDAENIPAAIVLPNPVDPALREFCDVFDFEVQKQHQRIKLNLDPARRAFKAALSNVTESVVRFDAGTIKIEPGEMISVRTNYVMVKEPEDTEVLQTLYPADGIRVTITDQTGEGKRIILAKSIHRTDIQNESALNDGSTKIFRISKYLLPHQGVMIWWKRTVTYPDADQDVLELSLTRHEAIPHDPPRLEGGA